MREHAEKGTQPRPNKAKEGRNRELAETKERQTRCGGGVARARDAEQLFKEHGLIKCVFMARKTPRFNDTKSSATNKSVEMRKAPYPALEVTT